mmetsp:Transcript_37776/g.67478  ORF Transcript_37776/g.67478 Transcript_37776/m.67478 type:complete len:80 (-) Transcript_37776:1454-1693(-)
MPPSTAISRGSKGEAPLLPCISLSLAPLGCQPGQSIQTIKGGRPYTGERRSKPLGCLYQTPDPPQPQWLYIQRMRAVPW